MRRSTSARRSVASSGAAAAVLLLASCTLVHQRAEDRPVSGTPSSQRGVLQYGVGRLSFLAPDAWQARGDEKKLHLAHPDDQGRLDVQRMDTTYRDEKGCLAAAQESLAKRETSLSNVRRHGSSFAGRRAVAQEADSNGWHGWAWALCDGATQYRVFFAGRAPVRPEVMDAWRTFTKSARVGDGR